MKKLLLTLIVLSGVAFSSLAQKASGNNSKFSAGVEVGVPLGDASLVYDLGLGLSLKYDKAVAERLAFTLSAGYTTFFVKNNLTALGAQETYGYIPLKGGLKYYLNKDIYAEGQLGITLSTTSGGGSAFTYAPGVGYLLGSGFDAGIRYEAWSNNGSLNQVGLHLAYSF